MGLLRGSRPKSARASPKNVLTVLQISSKSVHFRWSNSRTRQHRVCPVECYHNSPEAMFRANNEEEMTSVKHELVLPFLLCNKIRRNYHLVTYELVLIRKTIACLYQTGPRTPVSTVTHTHTDVLRAHDDCAEIRTNCCAT